MLDNWGDLIGLKGSGSHSVVIEDVLVPAHLTITLEEWLAIGVTSTPGYRLHGNPLYGGSFIAVALGELNSVQVGNAQAAVDEYERMLGRPTRQVAAAEGKERSRDPNHQRVLGLALAYTDAANSILMRCGELYHEYAREAMEGGGDVRRGAHVPDLRAADDRPQALLGGGRPRVPRRQHVRRP